MSPLAPGRNLLFLSHTHIAGLLTCVSLKKKGTTIILTFSKAWINDQFCGFWLNRFHSCVTWTRNLASVQPEILYSNRLQEESVRGFSLKFLVIF